MIKALIISNMKDNELKFKLLQKDRTLSEVLVKAQQKEDATARDQVMNKTESGSVNKMGTKWPNKKRSGQRNNDQQEEKDWIKNCKLCGYEKHAADRCPARDRRCLACNEIGHFSKHCSKRKDKSSTKKVTKVEGESDTDTDDDSDCKKVVVFSVNNKTTLMKIKMNGNDTQWQPDTGSNKN